MGSAFKTAAEQNVYQRLPDGTAILDGYPIVWTDVMQSFTTSAAADSPIAVFGAMSFWLMGEHGSLRLDTSEHVYFANDQLAVRFIEESTSTTPPSPPPPPSSPPRANQNARQERLSFP